MENSSTAIKFFRAQAVLFIFLIFDIGVVAAHFALKTKYGFFNLDGEGNLNSTYSGLKLMLVGFLAALQFLILWKIKKNLFQKMIWLLVSLSFFYLALDEMMAIHERAGFVFNNLFGLTGFDGASFNWTLYYAPFIAIALIVYVKLIFELRRQDAAAFALVFLGAILFFLALTTEAVSGKIIYPRGLLTRDFNLYFAFIIIEEVLELLGATFFLAGVFKSAIKSFNKYFILK